MFEKLPLGMTMNFKSPPKTQATGKKTPIKSRHDRKVPRGYGAMRDVPLNIDPRIDLTKPIHEQVAELEKLDPARHS